MLRGLVVLLAGWVAAMSSGSGYVQAAAEQQRPAGAVDSPQASPPRDLLDEYCVTCHSDIQHKLGRVPISLQTVDVTRVDRDAPLFENVVRKVRAGLMPPGGQPRPDEATLNHFAEWLETELDRAAAANPDPGRTEAFHRLNRSEYQNVVRDVLALDIDAAALLPADDASYGFDNIAGVLRVSPAHMERYLSAARRIARLAVGIPPASPTAETFRLPGDLNQADHIRGLPFGTRGGTAIPFTFPADAEYVVEVELLRNTLNQFYVSEPHEIEVTVDGERVGLFSVQPNTRETRRQAPQEPQEPPAPQPAQEAAQTPQGQQLPRFMREAQERERLRAEQAQRTAGQQQPAIQAQALSAQQGYGRDNDRNTGKFQVRVAVKAGPRVVGAAFVQKTSALEETLRLPFERPATASYRPFLVSIASVTITGPFGASGLPADATPSQRRIFVCRPAAASHEAGCARTIVSTLAGRAYARPVTDEDIEPLVEFYEQGRTEGGSFEAGIEIALQALLVSPEFLFRIERDPPGAAPGTAYRVSDLELASRLSFFLWSSVPDDELLDAAVRGTLRDPAVLEQQVRRMLADGRSRALVNNFAAQWLYLRNLPAKVPDEVVFPNFDEGLRQAFRQETELFVESIMREDRSVLDLLSAEYTFVNERLARHYGIPNVYGSHFRRVTIADQARRGLLGHGSVLSVTSYANRTSPVVRGKWVLENLLGTPPPPPPPNVPALKENPSRGRELSMRERMEQHRSNPVCASCHRMMDPLGLSLEPFDAVGRWRTRTDHRMEPGGPVIDTSGVTPDGTRFEGPAGLRAVLLSRPEQFVTNLVEKMLTYALGRGIEHDDAPAVRRIRRDAVPTDYRFSSIVVGIVNSVPFQMRRSRS